MFKTIDKSMNSLELKCHSQNGTVLADNIAESDDLLKITATSIQIKQAEIPDMGERARIIPRNVATPFPPLNFDQTGNKCPKKTARVVI